MAAINLTTNDIFIERENKGALQGYIARAALFAGLLIFFVRTEPAILRIALAAVLTGVPLCASLAAIFLHLRKIRVRRVPAAIVITDNAFLAGLVLFSALVSRTVTASTPWAFDIPYAAIAVFLVLLNILPLSPLLSAASGLTASVIYSCAIVCFRALLLPADAVHPSLLPAIAVFPAIILAAGLIPAAAAYLVRSDASRLIKSRMTYMNLTRFFPPRVAKRLNRENGELRLSSEPVDFNASVMSIGIRSFPLLCEKYKSGDILAVLSSYYSHIPSIIAEHGGTVHSFCGDEIVASFGTPASRDDDAAESVLTATSIAESVSILNETFAENELPEIAVGIGIHFGPVSAAVVGTDARMEYTLIGSALSAARKLREACSAAEKDILVSKNLVEKLREDFVFNKIGSTTLRDTGTTLDFYSPAGE